jgi:hypothetical protein
MAEDSFTTHIQEVPDPIHGVLHNSRMLEDYSWLIISLAMYQYPIHLYMAIALRVANERLLSGDSENAWGFGQIVALILCAATLLECVKGVLGKINPFEKAHLSNLTVSRISKIHSISKRHRRSRTCSTCGDHRTKE